jgi:hypothetical protein
MSIMGPRKLPLHKCAVQNTQSADASRWSEGANERVSSGCRNLSSGRSGGLGGLLGGIGGGSVGGSSGLALGGVHVVVVLLAGRVDRDLNGNLAALNLLAVHLGASLLLELLRAKGDESETTALAGLTTSLELLDHEAGDGAEGDLGLGGGVLLEDLEKLGAVSID